MIFSQDFFPTPHELALRCVRELNLRDLKQGNVYLLDPSAGSGSLLDAAKPKFDYTDRYGDGYDPYRHVKCYAIEPEPEMQAILASKGYPVVAMDFLSYVPRMQYTHIIMNPPFSLACDHLLHAWEIMWAGKIVALFPMTSLEGKTVKERLVLQIIHDNGGKVVELGQAFRRAERSTDVEIAMIVLTKVPDGGESLTMDFDVHNTVNTKPVWGADEGFELVQGGFVEQLLRHCEASIDGYAAYNEARQKIVRHVAPFEAHFVGEDGKGGILKSADAFATPMARYNAFVEMTTEGAWNAVLSHPDLQMLLTRRARRMLDAFRKSQRRVDFNKENVLGMIAALMNKQGELLSACVDDAFDTMTRYHEVNKVYPEGWISNKVWMAARKIVLPLYIRWDEDSGFRMTYDSDKSDGLDDIDRAMCIVTGKRYNSIVTVAKAFNSTKPEAQTAESEFFAMRWFKKGTLHLTFKNKLEWELFNITAAKGRNWVMPGKGGL